MRMQEVIEKVVNGVGVVTSRSGDKVNGLSIAWMSQVAINPPLVMVAIGKGKYTCDMIQESKVFAVNILSSRQVELAKLFGLQSGRKIDKFSKVEYETKKTRCPILKDCVAYLDCRLYSTAEAGDHVLFIGEVVDAQVKSKEQPLIYNSKEYF